MAKDTFNLHEWVGNGEKNLLREDERLNEGYILPIIAGAVSGLFTYAGGVNNDPDRESFIDRQVGRIRGFISSLKLFALSLVARKFKLWLIKVILIAGKTGGAGLIAYGAYRLIKKAIQETPEFTEEEKAKGEKMVDDIEKIDKETGGTLTGDALAASLEKIKRELK